MKQVILSLAILSLFVGAAAAYAASWRLGNMQVFSLLDVQGESPVSLLVGATEEQIAQYAPDGKLQSQILAFLVKLPGRCQGRQNDGRAQGSERLPVGH